MLRPDFLLRDAALWEKQIEPGVYADGVHFPCRAEVSPMKGGRAYLCAACPVRGGDRLVIGGETYYVRSARQVRGMGGASHVEAVLA